VLTRRGAIHHLLRLGLLSPADLVDRNVSANEYAGRNRLVQVQLDGGGGYVVKQPRAPGTADAATMWIEAAVFWMSAHEPEFAELARWMPRFHHYDEPSMVLTTQLIAPSSSLYTVLASRQAQPEMLRELGHVFALLHGPVSACLARERTRKLFRTGPAWSLTLGTPQQMFAPATNAGRVVLQRIMEHPEALDALARAREDWRDAHLIHGDAKSSNVLVRADGSVCVIDWEIAAIGDGLWDVAGFVHSLLIPKYGEADELEAAELRARPLLDALWDGYTEALAEPPPGDDPRVTMLRLAGVRLVQMCLETTLFNDRIDPYLEATLRMGLELMTRPEQSRARWERAA
jgi:Phosphotransferase enzyme family